MRSSLLRRFGAGLRAHATLECAASDAMRARAPFVSPLVRRRRRRPRRLCVCGGTGLRTIVWRICVCVCPCKRARARCKGESGREIGQTLASASAGLQRCRNGAQSAARGRLNEAPAPTMHLCVRVCVLVRALTSVSDLGAREIESGASFGRSSNQFGRSEIEISAALSAKLIESSQRRRRQRRRRTRRERERHN